MQEMHKSIQAAEVRIFTTTKPIIQPLLEVYSTTAEQKVSGGTTEG